MVYVIRLVRVVFASQVQTLLSGVDHSSGSSGWLKQMVVSSPDDHQAMVDYESLVIQANNPLEQDGHDPLLASSASRCSR
ncbi:MAG: hypothetical protein PUD09_08565 [Coriobacteriales bacterium]|nr:hypothetical protein [Coriobacteriales bacterium]